MSAASDEALARGRAGLHSALAGAEPTAIHPTPAQLGAEAGEAHAWTRPDVVARLYAFASVTAATAALDMLRDTVGETGNGAVNGALMLWATRGADDDEAADDLIDDLRSAVAGRER